MELFMRNKPINWQLLLILLYPLLTSEASAAIRGVVIGVDKYPKITDGNLYGAVNDAKDIASALKNKKVKEVITLLDTKVTRKAVLSSWKKALRNSTTGDLLVLSFAGHGIQIPERMSGSETDGFDEAIVMSNFAFSGPGTKERIIDDEIAAFLKQASDTGVKVLFIADACHSGTMTRGIDSRVRQFKVRALLPSGGITFTPPDDMTIEADAANIDTDNLNGINYLGAVQDHKLAPETIIDNKVRGALSWAAAKAIRGQSDINRDGKITDREFASYVNTTVTTFMEGQQQPSIHTTSNAPTLLFTETNKTFKKTKNNKTFKNTKNRDVFMPAAISIAILNSPVPVPELIAKLNNVNLVTDGTAFLTWDLSRGEVLNEWGDTVANVHNIAEELPIVQNVINKWQLIEMVRAAVTEQPITMQLEPEDKIFIDKEKVTLVISEQPYPYFTLFNVGSEGTINFLYPLRNNNFNDSLQIPLDTPYRLSLKIRNPFGAEHFIALSTAIPLESLHTALIEKDKKKITPALLKLIMQQLNLDQIGVGLRGVYTAQTTK